MRNEAQGLLQRPSRATFCQHDFRVTPFSCYLERDPSFMKNVTIILPEDVARWVRIKAAEDDRSVSR